jgi:hypothetical protein
LTFPAAKNSSNLLLPNLGVPPPEPGGVTNPLYVDDNPIPPGGANGITTARVIALPPAGKKYLVKGSVLSGMNRVVSAPDQLGGLSNSTVLPKHDRNFASGVSQKGNILCVGLQFLY